MASECWEPWRAICSMASSMVETTFTFSTRSLYSVSQSLSVAAFTSGTAALVSAHPLISTPAFMSRLMISGRNDLDRSLCTSIVSMALQVPGRWTFALKQISDAMARSALLSTYTWQTPLSCLITGMVEFSETILMSPSPPRGMMRSMNWFVLSISMTQARSGFSMNDTAPSGMPASAPARFRTSAMAVFDATASDPLRRELQAVEHGLGQALLLARIQVLFILGHKMLG